MAKKAKAVSQSNVAVMLEGIKSKKDFAYQHAKHLDSTSDFKAWAVENIAGFPDDVSAEDKAEIFAGYQLRFNDNNPAAAYIREGNDTFIPVVAGMDLSKREVINVGIDYAMSLTAHDYGALRAKQPNLHGIVGNWRKAFSKYASGRWAELTKKDAAERSRSVNKGFAVYLKDSQDSSVKRNKNALAKGDPTAVGVEILNQAWTAFWKVINQK